jgi:hypothetical protein
MKYVVIPADTRKPVEIREGDWSFETAQKVVGGWIEGVTVQPTETTPGLRMYCHEEGRIIGLQPNGRATALRVIATDGMFHPAGLLIAGDVAVIGGYDDHGNDVGLTEEQLAYLRRLEAKPES